MITPEAPVGVFDSGIGGLSILKSLRLECPAEHFVYFADTAYAPYGEKGDGYVVDRSLTIARILLEQHHVKALVVACNTATAAAIGALRASYPNLPIVGVEPALKPALALTRTGHIGVFATRGTVNSAKFVDLLNTLNGQARFTVTACDGLAYAIEAQDEKKAIALIKYYVSANLTFSNRDDGIDTLVLGCTHYPLELDTFRSVLSPDITVVEPGAAVARQLSRLLALNTQATQGERVPAGFTSKVTWVTSAVDKRSLVVAVQRWMPDDQR